MSRRAGFTIIELIITMAITVILLLAAIPRYEGYVNKQEFATAAQTAVDCVRSAQRQAIAPGADANGVLTRYVGVALTQNGNDLTCTTTRYRALDSSTHLPVVLNLSSIPSTAVVVSDPQPYIIKTGTLKLRDVTFPGVASSVTTKVSVFFGVIERGAPVLICGNAACSTTNRYPEPYTASLGQGFASSLALEDPSDASINGSLSIATLGNPIVFTLK